MSAQPVHYEYPDPEPHRDPQAASRITGEPREIAEQIENASGLRVEILRGTLMMSPTPRRRHAQTADQLRELLRACRADGLRPYENVSIPLPDDPDDYATPDMLICQSDMMDSDDWLLAGEDVELAIEVTSPSERPVAVADKIAWYAEARVPVLLYLYPATGRWTLHSRPSDEGYRTLAQGKYGDPVPLPGHLGGDMPTADLPRYER
ncbi:Uma2 family endonuclease [Streptomyces sp. I05A-00742]|uniref:Uma2 family endonuclease n=1 Tax=Streptomyces sp. I05A-00742 TaxID=2732853 RepID=UPI001489C341|nr:Uma2 family endonuclease [Streptomyces sp. I05A-00742]